MGKRPRKIDYARAMELIQKEKYWDGCEHLNSGWVGSKSTPPTFKVTASLLLEGITVEGCFVVVAYKRSPSGLARDAFSASFFVDNARVVGVDDGKPSTHFNSVGIGYVHHRQTIPHPHLHLPVEEASYGYAIPLNMMSTSELWELFLKEAGIKKAPSFMPPEEQGRLNV